MAPPCTATTSNANDLFEYTTGRWIVNDKPRRADRRREFNVDGLRRLAAESVKRIPDDIVSLRKIGEGGFNRVFLITMRDGFRMVARIPYLTTAPKYFAVASEAATMVFLRDSGLPVPEGETFELKVPLIHATERWEALAGKGVPCPIVFDPDDVHETKKLDAVQREMDGYTEVARDKLGVGADDWVPAEHYEETKARSKQWKEFALAAEDDVEERARAAAHWPFDDMDETDYL